MASDCRIKYRKDILADSLAIAKKRLSTIISVSDTKLVVPFFGGTLQRRDQAIRVSSEITAAINDKYNAKTFGAVAFSNTNPDLQDGVEITLAVPSLLLDAYEVKYGQKDLTALRTSGTQGKLFHQVEEPVIKSEEEKKLFPAANEGEVQYMLKAVNILNSDLGKKIFEKGQKSNWPLEKTLTELQIPKEQKQLILDLGKTNREEIITDLLANYSYTVEINTAKERKAGIDRWSGKEEDLIPLDEETPTQYYSNLTVPGGTNYTENEIATPAITPSIKGHAQFATDKGIGWFRSDEQISKLNNYEEWINSKGQWFINQSSNATESELKELYALETKDVSTSKTRRILEVQSDLFQKSRASKRLVNEIETPIGRGQTFTYKGVNYTDTENRTWKGLNETITRAEYTDILQKATEESNENQFLQLLNKDNNWITFFVKSIIQDSAKKGYEKVLFPTGNTASKVEGHTTLEEFKKQKEDRIKELEDFIDNPTYDKIQNRSLDSQEKQIEEQLEKSKNEIAQLKAELERVETEGFGALKPIYNFYENTVTNILRKQGYNPKLITDEYGNTWNEVTITPQNQEVIYFSTIAKSEVRNKLREILTSDVVLPDMSTDETVTPTEGLVPKMEKPDAKAVVARMQEILKILGISITIGKLPADVAAMADILNRTILFANGELTADNLTEETLHFIVEIVEQKYPQLFQSLMNEIVKYPLYSQVLANYGQLKEYQRPDGTKDLYKLKKEAITQLLTQKLLTPQPIRDNGYLVNIWNAITKFLNRLFGQLPFQVRDSFADLTEQIFNSDFLTENDKKYLNNPDFFYATKGNRVQKELAKARAKFGGTGTKLNFQTSSAKDVYDFIKNKHETIKKVTQVEINEDGESEEVEYYESQTGLKQRITSFLKEASKNLYANIDKSTRSEIRRQVKMQKGTEIHKTIEDVVKRYIDPDTGLLRATPEPRPADLGVEREVYNYLEYYLEQRLKSYPQGTYFLPETRVVYEEAGLAGTIDFIAISPTKSGGFTVDVLDWKTTDMKYSDYGVVKARMDISPYNQQYWRDQLEMYKSALITYGIPPNVFRKTWAIPIIVETETTKLDKSKPLSLENQLVSVKNIKIGNLDPSQIPSEDFATVPVATQSAYTGSETLDKTIGNLWEIYKRVKSTTYPEAQRLKKRKDLDDILATIRELQVQKRAKRFAILFHDSYHKYRQLLNRDMSFLENLTQSDKLLTEEQSEKLNVFLSELYDAIEFLSAFDNFGNVINELYPEKALSEEDKRIIQNIKNLGANSGVLKEQLINKAAQVVDKLGEMYDVDKVSSLDLDDNRYGKFLVSLLHRDEKTIQLAARMINAMTYLGRLSSKEYFDPNNGKFVQVYNNFVTWASKKGLPLEEAYKKLFKREVIEFVFQGKTYTKTKDGYLKNNKEIDRNTFYDTLHRHKAKVKITKYGKFESLIAKIDSTFFDLLAEKQTEFTERFEAILEELEEKKYRGKNKVLAAKAIYAKEVFSFLQDNFDLAAYNQAYKEAYEKYVESAKLMTFDTDPIADEKKRERFIEDWVSEHDIYNSPRALSNRNWLLKINEDKWISAEYKALTLKENKPLLDAYELFTEINQRALKAGMLTDVVSPLKFLPLVEEEGFLKSLHLSAKELKATADGYTLLKGASVLGVGLLGGAVIGPTVGFSLASALAIRYLYKNLSTTFKELATPEKEAKYSKDLSDITGKVKRERKILYKYVQNEEYVSSDLFRNYALWIDHIIKFETISAFEDRFEMIQMLEHSKKKIRSTDAFGNEAYAATASGLLDLGKKAVQAKQTTTERDLTTFIDNYLYSTSLDYKPPYYKLLMHLRDAASATFIGLRPTLWVVNFLGGSSSGSLLQGKKFKNWDFEKSLMANFGIKGAVTFGTGLAAGAVAAAITPGMPLLIGSIAGIATAKTAGKKISDLIFEDSDYDRKKEFLIELVGTRISSEYDKSEFDIFKNKRKTTVDEILYSGFRDTDNWLQDSIASAIFMNTTVIDGKFVNIVEHVKKKYEKDRYVQVSSSADKYKLAKKNRQIEEKIDKEIDELREKRNLFKLLKPSKTGFNIDGINLNTVQGKNELLTLSNTIHSYIKTTLGNYDENDKSIARLTWYMTFVMQFKNWMPRLWGSRFGELEVDYERNEVTLGRYRAFGNAILHAPAVMVQEILKNLSPLLAYITPTAAVSGLGLASGTFISKYAQSKVKYNVDLQAAAEDNYYEQLLKWEAQGKDINKFPSKAEFIDLYINGVSNTLKALQQVAFVNGILFLIMAGGSGDDDKKSVLRLLARIFFGLNKELGNDKDPRELIRVLEGIVPVVGYLNQISLLLSELIGEAVAEVEYSITHSGKSRKKLKKYHPYHRFMNVMPGLRELHYWMLATSKEYAQKVAEVPQPRSQE